MKLSERIPVEVYKAIQKVVDADHLSDEENKESVKIDRKWDVIILDHAERSFPKGLFTTILVMEEAFPGENPLTIQLTKENVYLLDDKKRYVIYSEYIESIEITLPVGCSIIGRTLLTYDQYVVLNSNTKLNFFLHYVNAKESILERFKNDLIEMMDKGNFYADICDMDQKMLQYNTLTELEKKRKTKENEVIISDWYRDHVIKRYWKKIIEKIHENRNMGSWIYKLKKGEDLTYNMCHYLLEDTKFEEHCKNRNDENIMAVKKALEYILCEKKYIQLVGSYISADFFIYALRKYIGACSDHYKYLIGFLE
jgi:hypothetical protein